MSIKRIFYIFILIILIFFFSCEMNHKDNNESKKGSVLIQIPSIFPYTKTIEDRNIPNYNDGERNKAIGISTKLEFILRDSGDVIADSWQIDLLTFMNEQARLNVAVGTDYTIEARIYNTTVSTSPTVTGISNPFNVIAGQQTSISITCTPTNTQEIDPGIIYSFTTTPTYLEKSSFPPVFYNYGGEKWYSFTATSGLTLITGIPEAGNMPVFSVFHSDGIGTGGFPSYIYDTYYFSESHPISALIPTATGFTYTIFCAPITFHPDSSSTMGIMINPDPTDDTLEENDDFDNAKSLSINTEIAGINLDDDYYKIDVVSQTDITVYAGLSEYVYASLHLKLYSDSNLINPIDDLYISNNTTIESYDINLPAVGQYYLVIPFGIFMAGGEYTLKWCYRF